MHTRIAANKPILLDALVTRLRQAWVTISVNPLCAVPTGAPLPGEVALQGNLYIYGLISIENAGSGISDHDAHSRCIRYGIEWTRCTGLDDIQRCVDWAIELQDNVTRCNAMPAAA